MRRSRSPASSYCSASGRDNSDWDVWAFKVKLRLRSGTPYLALEVSAAQKGSAFARDGYLHQSPICHVRSAASCAADPAELSGLAAAVAVARSPPIALQQNDVVRLVRVNPVQCGLNRFGQGFRLEWLPEHGVIAQFVSKPRQIRITTGEEHLEVGSVAACQAQRIQPRQPGHHQIRNHQ